MRYPEGEWLPHQDDSGEAMIGAGNQLPLPAQVSSVGMKENSFRPTSAAQKPGLPPLVARQPFRHFGRSVQHTASPAIDLTMAGQKVKDSEISYESRKCW